MIAKNATVAIDENQMGTMIEQIINENTKAFEDYKGGKLTTLAFFVGQLMKGTK